MLRVVIGLVVCSRTGVYGTWIVALSGFDRNWKRCPKINTLKRIEKMELGSMSLVEVSEKLTSFNLRVPCDSTHLSLAQKLSLGKQENKGCCLILNRKG